MRGRSIRTGILWIVTAWCVEKSGAGLGRTSSPGIVDLPLGLGARGLYPEEGSRAASGSGIDRLSAGGMVGRSSGSWRRAAECGEAKEERGGHVGSIGAWAAVRGGGDLEGMGETREEVYSDSGDNSRSTFPGSSGERDSRGLRRDEGMGIMDECVEEVVWPAQETTVKQVGNGKMTRR